MFAFRDIMSVCVCKRNETHYTLGLLFNKVKNMGTSTTASCLVLDVVRVEVK